MTLNPNAVYCAECGRELGSFDEQSGIGEPLCRDCYASGVADRVDSNVGSESMAANKLSIVCMPVDEILKEAEEEGFRFTTGTYFEEHHFGHYKFHGCAIGFLTHKLGRLEDLRNAQFEWRDALADTGYDMDELFAFECGFMEWLWDEDDLHPEFIEAYNHGQSLNQAVFERYDEEWDDEEWDDDAEEEI